MREPAATITGVNVYLRPPRLSDAGAFHAAVRASTALHRGWTSAPGTPARYAKFVQRYATRRKDPTHAGFLVFRRADDALVGVYNFSEIVRGAFQSAYLGYFGFVPLAGKGLMSRRPGCGTRHRLRQAQAASRGGQHPADQYAFARPCGAPGIHA